MINFTAIHDKKFSAIFVEEDGSEDGKWTILIGVAKWRDGHLYIFRGMDKPEFPVPDDTLDRIKPVLPEARELLEQAEFCIMFTVGQLEEDVNPSEITHTGLTLPRDGDDMDKLS